MRQVPPARPSGRKPLIIGAVVAVVVGMGLGFVWSRFGKGGARDASAVPGRANASASARTSGATPADGAAAASPDQPPPDGAPAVPPEPAEPYLSPVALVADKGGKTLYIAAHTSRQVLIFDIAGGTVTKSIPLPDRPAGLALSPDGKRLFVTGASTEGRIHVIDTAGGAVASRIAVGHTPTAVAVAPDGQTLYVANRFHNTVSVVDALAGKEKARIPVQREPVALALTPDGRFLFVGNHLPAGPANGDFTAVAISVIDTGKGQVTATVPLPNGSTSLRGLCLSPDGKHLYVTHILGRYQLPTTQLERGWMNTNALSILRTEDARLVNTVLLDSVDLGAANPWGVGCSDDGAWLCVAHAGTHEVSLIDRAALHAKLDLAAAGKKVTDVTSYSADVPNDLAFLHSLRRRIRLAGQGPRGLVVVGTKVYAAEYFSDSLGVVGVEPSPRPSIQSIPLGAKAAPTPERRGELIFNDADRCFQKWQSCASCHPDGRADGLNWDLLNDGIGNPKNTKSMLLAAQTPPSMSLGIREDFGAAVRAGFRVIQFTTLPEEEYAAVEAFLKGLRPVSSPHRVRGALSPAAKRGEAVFATAGCAACHPPPLLTDLKTHDLGLGLGLDRGKTFDTPTLVEIWRTAPYLYDGRAVTVKEVLTKFNAGDRHGRVSTLSPEDLDALVEYVLSQ